MTFIEQALGKPIVRVDTSDFEKMESVSRYPVVARGGNVRLIRLFEPDLESCSEGVGLLSLVAVCASLYQLQLSNVSTVD